MIDELKALIFPFLTQLEENNKALEEKLKADAVQQERLVDILKKMEENQSEITGLKVELAALKDEIKTAESQRGIGLNETIDKAKNVVDDFGGKVAALNVSQQRIDRLVGQAASESIQAIAPRLIDAVVAKQIAIKTDDALDKANEVNKRTAETGDEIYKAAIKIQGIATNTKNYVTQEFSDGIKKGIEEATKEGFDSGINQSLSGLNGLIDSSSRKIGESLQGAISSAQVSTQKMAQAGLVIRENSQDAIDVMQDTYGQLVMKRHYQVLAVIVGVIMLLALVVGVIYRATLPSAADVNGWRSQIDELKRQEATYQSLNRQRDSRLIDGKIYVKVDEKDCEDGYCLSKEKTPILPQYHQAPPVQQQAPQQQRQIRQQPSSSYVPCTPKNGNPFTFDC